MKPRVVTAMPLRLSNKPEIHLAQEWIAQLHLWIRHHGLTGHDPLDIKAHPFLRRLQESPYLRRITTLFCDMHPTAVRRILGIAPTLNPEALALAAMGHFRLYKLTNDTEHQEHGLETLQQLRDHALSDHEGLCWGYPFALRGVGYDIPPHEPATAITATAGEAFLLAHDATGDTAHLQAARDVATFMLESLPRLKGNTQETDVDDTWCFGYAPGDTRRIHSANVLAVAHVIRTAARLEEEQWNHTVAPALQFSLARQRDDGSWPYGDYIKGEPHDPKRMRVADHHHTGCMLRALHAVHEAHPDEAVRTALEKGVRFYRTLIRPDGRPIRGRVPWPVDIRACAEGMLCPVQLGSTMPGWKNTSLLVMRWAHRRLRDKTTGAPWARRHPLFVSRIVYPCWGVAWMYYALAEYLYRRREEI